MVEDVEETFLSHRGGACENSRIDLLKAPEGTWKKRAIFPCKCWELLWMDKILHHFETMGNLCLLVFTGEPSFQGFLGGAGFRSSTVLPVNPWQ